MQVIVPYLTVRNAAEAIDFYVRALGATENSRAPTPDGRIMHADLVINGGSIYLMDEFPEHESGSCGTVRAPSQDNPAPVANVINYGAPADVDAAFARAVDAGCAAMMQPEDAFWGARFAAVCDPYGHVWMLNAELPGKA